MLDGEKSWSRTPARFMPIGSIDRKPRAGLESGRRDTVTVEPSARGSASTLSTLVNTGRDVGDCAKTLPCANAGEAAPQTMRLTAMAGHVRCLNTSVCAPKQYRSSCRLNFDLHRLRHCWRENNDPQAHMLMALTCSALIQSKTGVKLKRGGIWQVVPLGGRSAFVTHGVI